MNIFQKIKWFFVSGAPSIKKDSKISLKELKNKTKKQLEKIGRKLGVELDRRLQMNQVLV